MVLIRELFQIKTNLIIFFKPTATGTAETPEKKSFIDWVKRLCPTGAATIRQWRELSRNPSAVMLITPKSDDGFFK